MKERYIKIYGFEYYIRQYKPTWMPFWSRRWIVDGSNGQPYLYKRKNGKYVIMLSKETRDNS